MSTSLRRHMLLDAIRTEGGEWTVGRVKRLYGRHTSAHILRNTIRKDLAALHQDGHLTLHDSPHRRVYTHPAPVGADASPEVHTP